MAPGPAARALERAVYIAAEAALRSLPPGEAADTYVVSFYVYDASDDPTSPTLTVGHNTEAQVAATVDGASDEGEARWNYAFWLQDELAAFPLDALGEDLLAAMVEEVGDAADDEELLHPVTAAFVDVLVRVAKELHARGVVQSVFGRPLPIVIHELEYYDRIAAQTREANPPGVADEFARWVDEG